MANRFLTLNVGASQAVLAEYSVEGRNDLALIAYGMAPMASVDADSPGSMEAVLTPALHQIMRETGIKPGPVVVSLNGHTVFPRFAKVPSVSDAEKLRQIIGYEVEQNVPFPMDEIVWGHQLLGTTADGDSTAIIMAAKLDHVRGVTNAVVAAGFRPEIVDVAPMAVYNCLRFSTKKLEGCNVILDLGSRDSSLIIVEDEKVYVRTIPIAGNAITKEIAQAFGCSLEDAEQLKRDQGYVSLGGVMEDPDEVRDRISKVIRGVFTRLHAEIARSINFYRSQQGGSPPVKMYLSGGTALIPQTDEFFRSSLQVEVEFLNPFAGIRLGSGIDSAKLEGDALTLNESVGLALRKTDLALMQFDLTPPEILAAKRAAGRLPFVIAGELMILAALALGIAAVCRDRDVAVAQNDAIVEQRSRLQKFDSQIKAAQKETDAEAAAAGEMRSLLASRPLVIMQLDAVRRALLPGMWIREWQNAPVREGAPAKALVTIRGWKDELSAGTEGKTGTAAELVQATLKGRSIVKSVGISKQVDDVAGKGCLEEFTLEIEFVDPAEAVEAPTRRGAKGGRK